MILPLLFEPAGGAIDHGPPGGAILCDFDPVAEAGAFVGKKPEAGEIHLLFKIKHNRFFRTVIDIDITVRIKVPIKEIIFLTALQVDVAPVLAGNGDVRNRLEEIRADLDRLGLRTPDVGPLDIAKFIEVVAQIGDLTVVGDLLHDAAVGIADLTGKFRMVIGPCP